MNDSATLLVELERILGIRPTQHWLGNCIEALQQETNISIRSTNDRSVAVVEQILNHDLRDVVRTFGEDSARQNDLNAASQTLRASIRRSLDAESNFKASLPEAFRLLVQIEEFVDVALNLEKRLEMVTGNSPGIPQKCSNGRTRCLKFCYSDGYQFQNDSQAATVEVSSPLIAMEVTPINGLGTQYNLLAGIKILLHGPVIVRHGVAGWHSGNATILGGNVPSLIEIQIEALNRLKHNSGHGIDPTIRALIWNNPNNDVNNNEGKYR
jgi:RecQ mediated genome instability protein